MPYCPIPGCGTYRWDAHGMQVHLRMTHRSRLYYNEQGEQTVGKLQPTEVQLKICPNKRCTLHNKEYETDSKFCGVCATKLQVQYGRAKTDTKVDPTFGAPYPADTQAQQGTEDRNEYVWRRHVTVWNGKTGAPATWSCWCGFNTDNIGETTKHDNMTAERVLKSSLKPGDGFTIVSSTMTGPAKPTQTDDWTCTPDVQGCPLITDAHRPKLEVTRDMWYKWMQLADRVETEWFAYLIGEPIEPSDRFPKGGWKVTDFYFPRQMVTKAHARVLEEEIRNLKPGVIGDIHSHVRMNAYFSGEDEAHMNHPVHIVINARGEFATSVRVELDCKRTSRVKGAMYLTGEDQLAEVVKSLESSFVEDPPDPPTPAKQMALPKGNGENGGNGVDVTVHSPRVVGGKPGLVAAPPDDDDLATWGWGV